VRWGRGRGRAGDEAAGGGQLLTHYVMPYYLADWKDTNYFSYSSLSHFMLNVALCHNTFFSFHLLFTSGSLSLLVDIVHEYEKAFLFLFCIGMSNCIFK
jgi:hypothetical protein